VQQITASPLEALVASWQLSMRARNLSAATQGIYLQSARQLVAFLAARGVTTPEEIDKSHVEEFIASLAETRSPGTASVRFRALQQWFAWMVDEEEIPSSPVARMRPTVVPEQPPSVLHVGEVPKSLATALRKAVTLGGELKSVPLREWASRELRGYEDGPDGKELPDHRRISAPGGDVSGHVGR